MENKFEFNNTEMLCGGKMYKLLITLRGDNFVIINGVAYYASLKFGNVNDVNKIAPSTILDIQVHTIDGKWASCHSEAHGIDFEVTLGRNEMQAVVDKAMQPYPIKSTDVSGPVFMDVLIMYFNNVGFRYYYFNWYTGEISPPYSFDKGFPDYSMFNWASEKESIKTRGNGAIFSTKLNKMWLADFDVNYEITDIKVMNGRVLENSEIEDRPPWTYAFMDNMEAYHAFLSVVRPFINTLATSGAEKHYKRKDVLDWLFKQESFPMIFGDYYLYPSKHTLPIVYGMYGGDNEDLNNLTIGIAGGGS